MINPVMQLLVGVAVAAAPTISNEWLFISQDDNGTKAYLQKKDFLAGRPEQRAAKAWVLMDHSRDATIAWQTSKALYSVDCVGQSYTRLTATIYYSDGRRTTLDGGERTYIVPETTMDSIAIALCAAPRETTPARLENVA